MVGQGNTGFSEVVRVTPTKTPSRRKRQSKMVDVSVQQAVSQETQEEDRGWVTPNRHSKQKRKCVTASSNKQNILPESGKTHNTRASNGTHTRHTSRQLRHTYKDINYKDMDVISEEDESPPHKCEPSIAVRLHVPSYPHRQSQGIITRNRLQRMASPNTRAKLIITAIKVEPVKKEDDVKKEPIVNTRRLDRSWPKSAKLVHLDRTPCSEECIVNDHYGKYPDFPDDSPAEPRVMRNKNDATATDTALNIANTAKRVDPMRDTDDNITPLNVMLNKDLNHGNMHTEEKDMSTRPSASKLPIETPDADPLNKVDSVTPTNTDESMEDGVILPDLGSKQAEPEPQATTLIDLPDEVADEVTLPDVHVDFGHDELASDFLDNEVDNAAILGVNAAPVTDFAREMAQEEGVDRDLELELENLTFLEEQNSKQENKEKNVKNKDN